jgi:hypothetical protein
MKENSIFGKFLHFRKIRILGENIEGDLIYLSVE